MIELVRVQPEFGGVGFEGAHFQGGGAVKQDVAIFPEFVLVISTLPGLRGNFGGGEGVREIAPDEMNLVAVLGAQLIKDTGPVPGATGRSTKVPVFDDGHARIGRAEGGVVV